MLFTQCFLPLTTSTRFLLVKGKREMRLHVNAQLKYEIDAKSRFESPIDLIKSITPQGFNFIFYKINHSTKF